MWDKSNKPQYSKNEQNINMIESAQKQVLSYQPPSGNIIVKTSEASKFIQKSVMKKNEETKSVLQGYPEEIDKSIIDKKPIKLKKQEDEVPKPQNPENTEINKGNSKVKVYRVKKQKPTTEDQPNSKAIGSLSSNRKYFYGLAGFCALGLLGVVFRRRFSKNRRM